MSLVCLALSSPHSFLNVKLDIFLEFNQLFLLIWVGFRPDLDAGNVIQRCVFGTEQNGSSAIN